MRFRTVFLFALLELVYSRTNESKGNVLLIVRVHVRTWDNTHGGGKSIKNP